MAPKGAPFYSMYNVGTYTFAPYKVVWNRMGEKLMACVISTVKDPYLGEKLVLPENVLVFTPTDNEDEAHYICAIMNSSIVDLTLRSIAGGTKSFGTPKIIEDTLRIEKYDPKNPIHRKLAELSKRAHKLAEEGREEELRAIEKEIDKLVAQLYGITDEELKEVYKALAILEGKEIEEEEVLEEVPVVEPEVFLANPVVEEGKPVELEIVVRNTLDEPITNVKVKAELLGKTVEELFDEIREEAKITMRLEGLKRGQHKIKLTLDYIIAGESKRIEKEQTLFVKERERKPIERGGIEEIFGDEWA